MACVRPPRHRRYTDAWPNRASNHRRHGVDPPFIPRARSTAPTACSLAVTVERGRDRDDRRQPRGALHRRLHLRQGAPVRSTRLQRRTACSIRSCARAPRAAPTSSASPGTRRSTSSPEGCEEARDHLRRRVGAALLLRRVERAADERPRGRALLPPIRRVAISRARCARRRPAPRPRALYGKMAGVAYEDYEDAQLIVIWGCNPSASGIHLVPHIKRAQNARRQARRRRSAAHAARAAGRPAPARAARARICRSRWRSMRALFEARPGRRGVPRRHMRRRRRPAGGGRRRGRSSGRPRRPASTAATSRTLAEWYGTISPAVIRCGWGQERNRNGGVGDDGHPGPAGRRRQVRRPRRRLHDEQLGRVGHRRPSG